MTPSELMARFSDRTGLTGAKPQRRYLWTDAFAVCTFIGLGHVDEALALIAGVHRVLGRHRDDDPRRGWISGLSETDGEAHPTLGGLRIGKPMPERHAGEPPDDELEWDRDGQYFHYLTKWMHALDQAARVTGDRKLATWALELADTAHRRFVYASHGSRRMYWKMSIDLMRPQVASMGHHDPLDGYVTCLQLARTSTQGPDLTEAIRRLTAYAEAGADCLYAPGVRSVEDIRAVVEAVAPKPVNVLVGSDFTSVAEMKDLGVRRISDGGALARAAWGGFLRAAREIAEKGTFTSFAQAVSFADIDGAFDR